MVPKICSSNIYPHMVSSNPRLITPYLLRGMEAPFVALLVYVDDILLTGPSPSSINSVKDSLKAHFKLKDLGQATYFLGLELSRFARTYALPKKILSSNPRRYWFSRF